MRWLVGPRTDGQATGAAFPAGLADRLCAYARSVAHFPTALKEVEWRNGWFMELTFDASDSSLPDPLPRHTELMRIAEGKVFQNALEARLKQKSNIMADAK